MFVKYVTCYDIYINFDNLYNKQMDKKQA